VLLPTPALVLAQALGAISARQQAQESCRLQEGESCRLQGQEEVVVLLLLRPLAQSLRPVQLVRLTLVRLVVLQKLQ
jgi:hypothetical protein